MVAHQRNDAYGPRSRETTQSAARPKTTLKNNGQPSSRFARPSTTSATTHSPGPTSRGRNIHRELPYFGGLRTVPLSDGQERTVSEARPCVPSPPTSPAPSTRWPSPLPRLRLTDRRGRRCRVGCWSWRRGREGPKEMVSALSCCSTPSRESEASSGQRTKDQGPLGRPLLCRSLAGGCAG
jgi:hypothetical protein